MTRLRWSNKDRPTSLSTGDNPVNKSHNKKMFWQTVSRNFLTSDMDESPVQTDDVIQALRHFRITSASVMTTNDISLRRHLNVSSSDLGSTHKWLLTLEGGQKAIFKPDWQTPDVGYWFENFENPLNELMSYQVDRFLGFHKTPHTVGRSIHIQTEILSVASEALLQHLFQRGDEVCLRDKCYFCENPLEVCTQDGRLTGAMIYFIDAVSSPVQFPWDLQHYHKYHKYGFNNQTACTQARQGTLFHSNLHFLQLMDLLVLDLLTNHFDSKYYFIQRAGRSSSLAKAVFIDRGRAFSSDEYHTRREPSINILGLWQCCRISERTFKLVNAVDWTKATQWMFLHLEKDVLLTQKNRSKAHRAVLSMKKKSGYLQKILSKCYRDNKWQMFLSDSLSPA